jgi:hypothetical protein
MADVQAQLKDHLENGKDWSKMETPIPGVFVVKVPETKTRPALLFIEVNPLKSDGNPMKKKGLFIRNKEMYIAFKEALEEDAIFTILQNLEAVNPEVKGATATKKLKL